MNTTLRRPIASGSRSWRLAVPTEIWLLQLGTTSAHSDLALAVVVRRPLRSGGVRQCLLRSGARNWGPEVPRLFAARGRGAGGEREGEEGQGG